MLTRRFGRTELPMPVLSCGGMRYQHKWQDLPLSEIPKAGQENLEATIRRAVEVGVNHIETARGYGSSERQLGEILPALHDDLIVQTKIAPKADPKAFIADFRDSLARLKLERVDLLALHGINNAETLEWSLRPGGCFEAAQALRAEGLCRFIGFSTHGPLDVILQAIRHGEAAVGAGFDYVNLHWYFILQRNWPAIAEARARDMGVFIISPTDKGGQLFEPPDKLVKLSEPLSPIVFNDLFCLMQEEVHTLSVGAACPSDFDEHLKVMPHLERGLDAVRDTVTPIVARWRAAMKAGTGFEDPEAMSPTLPPMEATPGGHNLELILWLLHLARGWDMTTYAKRRFNMMGNASHWFPGAKAATIPDIDGAALDAALKGSPHRDVIPRLVQQAWDELGGEETKRESAS